MPRRTRPEPPLSETLHDAVRAFGSAGHVAILAYLASVVRATAPEILETVPMAMVTMHRHLSELEHLGVVSADVPVGQRRGRRVTYSLDRVRAQELLTSLGEALLGFGPAD